MARGKQAQRAQSQESDSGEEYEVEKIIQHKGKPGNYKYLVAWVGYPATENSWTEEGNLDCKELLESYWDSKGGMPAKMAGTSNDTLSSSNKPAKQRSSNGAATSKKRKASNTGNDSLSIRAEKRIKEDSSDGSGLDLAGVGHSKAQDVSDTNSEEENDADPEKIQKYMDTMDWEQVISKVVTVSRTEDGRLRFFVIWEDGTRAWVASELFYVRGPQKVIAFFEQHLKFKNTSN